MSITTILVLYILTAAVLYLLPIISIMNSNKTTGNEKLVWILAVLFISWFAWIFYLLLAPLKKK